MAAPDGADFNAAVNDNVVADLSRVWTLAEVVDVAAGIGPTGGTGREIDTTVLGYILEQTTGSSLADLVSQYVTVPLGIDGTTTDIAAPKQPGYQHGVFVLDGAVLDTASVSTDAYWSFLGAAGSATSTLPDLLDLLDAWVTGELLGSDRAERQTGSSPTTPARKRPRPSSARAFRSTAIAIPAPATSSSTPAPRPTADWTSWRSGVSPTESARPCTSGTPGHRHQHRHAPQQPRVGVPGPAVGPRYRDPRPSQGRRMTTSSGLHPTLRARALGPGARTP